MFASTRPTDLVEAVLEGFETARIPITEAEHIVMELGRASEVTEVVASALTSSGAAMERLGSTMSAPMAQKLPASRPRILQSLPLLPSVVRGRDGQLRIGGTRPHESSLWIDGFDVTDPVSGTSALDLPVESVKGMAVLRDPISATFSGVLGSLASIETTTGGDEFRAGVQGFIPRPRLSNYGLGKIEAFFPRAYASGKAGRAHYFGSIEFNFERVPVPGVTARSGGPYTGATGTTSFWRVDYAVSDRHTLTLEGLFAPITTVLSELSTQRTADAAPSIDNLDLFAGFTDRLVLGSSDLLTTRVGWVAHDTTLEASGSGDALLTPTGWQQNWFDRVDSSGSRRTVSLTWDHTNVHWNGAHTFSLSGDYRQRSMDATIEHHDIQVLDDAGRLLRRIRFAPSTAVGVSDSLSGFGARDVWDVSPQLQFDMGLRLDWYQFDSVLVPSPRLGVRYNLDPAGRTTLKASIGRFVGRAPLGAALFDQFAARTDTRYDPATGTVLRTGTLTPAVGRLVLPRAVGYAVELEHQIRPGLELQVSGRIRHGSSLPTVHVPDTGTGKVWLQTDGESTYRELQVALHQTWRDNAQLFMSYVHAFSQGDMNDFGTLFTNLDTPILEPAGQAVLPSDVPHRLRGWATFGLPRAVTLSPAIEWRTGFPYSALSAYREIDGEPNGARFPNHFAVDLTTFKTFDVIGRKFDLGLQIFNLTGHFNPRDVVPVTTSTNFGNFSSSFGVTLGGYMQVRW